MIFAREVGDPLTRLVKKLDDITEQNKKADMGSFVVFCSDDPGLEKRLAGLAEKEKLKHLILTIDNPAGPKDYQIAKDADVTVVLYTDFKVVANYVYRKGEFKDQEIDKILAANADKVAEYKSGKQQLFGFFVGQTMKAMAGKANPQVVNELLKKAMG